MAEWQSGDVVANGIKVHYHRTGGGGPPLVLNHGSTDNGLCWIRLARELEGEYDIIMPDARGHGQSEAPEGGYDSSTRAADLAAFIRALGLEKAAVGGHSMGAMTTFYLAATYPDLPRCAILEDPVFRTQAVVLTEEQRRARAERQRKETEERRAMTREQIMAWGRDRRPTWDESEFGPWADSKLQVSPRASMGGAGRPDQQADWRELAPKITCPTLLVTGDTEREAIVTPEAAAEAARLNPKVRVVRLHGAGHNIRREQFDGFLQAVRDFLKQ
jgi:N-formylmaleamate deformylase